jgi:hypothetical protein
VGSFGGLAAMPAQSRADETAEEPADAETASCVLTLSMALFMPGEY